MKLPHVIAHVAPEFPHRGPPSLQSPMHTGDANIPSQEELRLLVQPGTCTPIPPNAQENRAFVRLRTTI